MLTTEMGCELCAEFRKNSLLSLKGTEADQVKELHRETRMKANQPMLPFCNVKKVH